ncbi:ATP-binding protein [Streptomyces sp. NPDC020845]|uniref:ATP-binding protein n=1 Tax=Streptomyces sp. NPDC020845 TaxID=3365096 RepID=UPI00378AC4F3
MPTSPEHPRADFSLVFPPDPTWVRTAREAVRTALRTANRPDLTDTALLLTSEAVTNAVTACLHSGCAAPVTLYAEWAALGTLRVLVSDDAPGMPSPGPKPTPKTAGACSSSTAAPSTGASATMAPARERRCGSRWAARAHDERHATSDETTEPWNGRATGHSHRHTGVGALRFAAGWLRFASRVPMRRLAAFGAGECGFRLGPSGSKAPAGGGKGRSARCPGSSARRTVRLKTGSAALRRSCCRAVASRSAQRCAGPEAHERDERAGDRWTAWSGRRVRASSRAFGAKRPAAETGRGRQGIVAVQPDGPSPADGRRPTVDGRPERWTPGSPPTPSQKNTCSASSTASSDYLRGGGGRADPARRCPPSVALPHPGPAHRWTDRAATARQQLRRSAAEPL